MRTRPVAIIAAALAALTLTIAGTSSAQAATPRAGLLLAPPTAFVPCASQTLADGTPNNIPTCAYPAPQSEVRHYGNLVQRRHAVWYYCGTCAHEGFYSSAWSRWVTDARIFNM